MMLHPPDVVGRMTPRQAQAVMRAVYGERRRQSEFLAGLLGASLT